MTSLPVQCCTLPPFESDYKPVGERVTIEVDGKDVELYIAGPKDAKYASIGIHGESTSNHAHLFGLMK